MQMNKKSQKLYLILFIVVICLPILYWLVLGQNVVSDNYENRTLADKPTFSLDAYEDYSSQYESYFNDHFPFRNQLVPLNGLINYCVFNISTNESVILGKNNWLFFYGYEGENPIGDYEGTRTFSDEELSKMRDSCLSIQTELAEMGIRFAIIIPTNKERVYSQYMPEQYILSEASRTDMAIETLQEAGINIVNPKEDLLSLCSEYQLYYQYDTHWNQLGAYIGVCDILKSWDIEVTDLRDLTINSSELKDDYHKSASCDLAMMLNLRDYVFDDDVEYSIQECYSIEWSQVEQMNPMHLINNQAINDKTIVLVGDSFTVAMIPALCTYFSEVYVLGGCTCDTLEEISPDYLIVEYVERYSEKMQEIENLINLTTPFS